MTEALRGRDGTLASGCPRVPLIPPPGPSLPWHRLHVGAWDKGCRIKTGTVLSKLYDPRKEGLGPGAGGPRIKTFVF